ncbi:Hint domain-containing protein [Tepidamorphus sp. 3E244]|uniref:Hint domain-containing protein n=1 Tax=Tepidamorphus sp. 3E244 TaxID=3385498 RepID=UPI0038FC474A
MIGFTSRASAFKAALLSSTAIGLLTATQIAVAPAHAQDAGSLPAVSTFNAKLGIAAGVTYSDDVDVGGLLLSPAGRNSLEEAGKDELALFLASFTAPVHHRYGVQLDVAAGVEDDAFVGGIGGHFFWRDPDMGLLGITGAYAVNENDFSVQRSVGGIGSAIVRIDRQEITQLAAEAEAYSGNFTFHGLAGYQWGENIEEGAFARGGIRYYATENFMLGLGAGVSEEIGGFGTAEVEYLATNRVSVFADVRTEFDTYFQGLAGIRVYFGPADTLIAKHRQDDPSANAAQDALAGMQPTTTITDLPDCCFTPDTMILMADGTTRQIVDVRVGDLVLGEGGNVNRVMEIETPCLGARKLFAFNGGAPFVTAEHPFMTRAGWKSIDPDATFAETGHFRVGSLTTGDELVVLEQVTARAMPIASGASETFVEAVIETAHLTLAEISAHEDEAERTVFNLRLDGNHTYFANAFLVHNK